MTTNTTAVATNATNNNITTDPIIQNYLAIMDDCLDSIVHKNGTLTLLQCNNALAQANAKYCGIESYDAKKCKTVSVINSANSFIFNLYSGDNAPLLGSTESLPPPLPPPTTTSGGGVGGPTLAILNGSAIQGNPDYDPDELTVASGSDVTVTNQDTVPHTATSGTGSQDPNSAKLFDTSIINGGESATLPLAQVAAGQYDYYCMIHPYMTGKLVVQ